MDERTKQVLVGIIVAVIFIASVALIIIGQKNITENRKRKQERTKRV